MMCRVKMVADVVGMKRTEAGHRLLYTDQVWMFRVYECALGSAKCGDSCDHVVQVCFCEGFARRILLRPEDQLIELI
jgi:hypothetical protein